MIPNIRKTGGYGRPLTDAERLLQQAQMLVRQERRQAELDRQQRELERSQLETRTQVLEQAQILSRHDAQLASLEHRDGCLTILAWWKQRDIAGLLSTSLASQMGKLAAKTYRERTGLEPYRVADGRYGFVFQFPEELLDELFLNDEPVI